LPSPTHTHTDGRRIEKAYGKRDLSFSSAENLNFATNRQAKTTKQHSKNSIVKPHEGEN